jgi:hypothetical protein
MDCRTARSLLDYARAHAPELAADDAAGLERHLALCPECSALAAHDRRLDECLGRAMRAVEVPDGLRQMLVNRLDADRADWRRRVWGRALRYAAVAAAVLLVVVGYVLWRQTHLPEPNLSALQEDFNARTSFARPDREQVEEQLRRLGADPVAPRGLNYDYLVTCALTDLDRQKVPLLFFIRDEASGVHEHAFVYVLSDRQFKIENLRPPVPVGGEYRYKVDVLDGVKHDSKRYTFVILYTGDNLTWLRKAEPALP